ncbi:hypothetical protein H8959_016474 [Pygathrix nigripes]
MTMDCTNFVLNIQSNIIITCSGWTDFRQQKLKWPRQDGSKSEWWSYPGGGKKDDKDKKKKYEPPVPTRVGKKKKKTKGSYAASKLPLVTPHTQCWLKL